MIDNAPRRRKKAHRKKARRQMTTGLLVFAILPSS